ncbi:PadR family transcriptional regulator [Actinomadura violacea]|uniref:PadR family transcriptional regulator n=1 Tax=Actinomadura violacea TaxID=2819934 RepID=UPI001E3E509F|nr:PadR family transcriptional regulator [Actinomadura violacea]
MSAPVRSSPLALTVLALLHTRPLHPYGIQRLIKEWGKEQVVNVEQRASLYRTIDRLNAAGLIAVRQTERGSQYPERTVYEVTEAGRETARTWIRAMLAAPKREFPEFPAAVSNAMLLPPAELLGLLEERLRELEKDLAGLDASLGEEAEMGLPRVTMLDTEYMRAVTAAETGWVRSVVDDLRAGRLTWSREMLAAFDSGAR